jgi:polysaccharide pyruvyl transferase WcaK-like protein
MFITRRKHEALMAHMADKIDSFASELSYTTKVASDRADRLDQQAYLIDSLDKENRSVRRHLAEALSELHALKAKRARGNANLIPGGPKAKARVMAARAQQKAN